MNTIKILHSADFQIKHRNVNLGGIYEKTLIEIEQIISNKNISYYKKVIKPTSEELKMHKDYLKKELKKNFFN